MSEKDTDSLHKKIDIWMQNYIIVKQKHDLLLTYLEDYMYYLNNDNNNDNSNLTNENIISALTDIIEKSNQ